MLTLGWRSIVWHTSFLGVAVGAFLPWLVVAGQSRDGGSSAELLMSLADVGAPSGLRVLGALWYVGATMALVGWAAGTLAIDRLHRWMAASCLLLGAAAWLTFILWAAGDDRILLQGGGPAVALLGFAGLIVSEVRSD